MARDAIVENLVSSYKLKDSVVPSLNILLELLLKNTDEETAANAVNDFVFDFMDSLTTEFYGDDWVEKQRFEFKVCEDLTIIINEQTLDQAIKKALELLRVHDNKEGITGRDRDVSIETRIPPG
jgi:hypothetical protein